MKEWVPGNVRLWEVGLLQTGSAILEMVVPVLQERDLVCPLKVDGWVETQPPCRGVRDPVYGRSSNTNHLWDLRITLLGMWEPFHISALSSVR